MRAVWTGSIRIGEAAIPVRSYSATETRTNPLHQVHTLDGGRIRYRRICELDGAEVPADEVGKGHQLPGGEVVLVSADELAALPTTGGNTIQVHSFAPVGEIDPVYFARSYHLEPEPAGVGAYVLFSEALQQSGRAAVVTLALRGRTTLGMLRVRDQVISLETMVWPDEVRTPDFPFLHQEVVVDDEVLAEAADLVQRLSETFVPARYTDDHAARLEALIGAKVEGDEVIQPAGAAQRAGADELLSALRANARDREPIPAQRTGAIAAARAAASKAADAAKRAAGRSATTARTER